MAKHWKGTKATDQPRKKHQYRVIAGTHAEGDFLIKKGEIVHSDNPDLDKEFVNKFRKLTKRGRPVEEEDFEEEVPYPRERAPEEDDKPQIKEPKKESKEESVDDKEDKGKDVTSKVPSAEKNGVKVFQVGDTFNVYDHKDLDTPINEEPLTSKKAVKELIRSLTEDDSEDESDDKE